MCAVVMVALNWGILLLEWKNFPGCFILRSSNSFLLLFELPYARACVIKKPPLHAVQNNNSLQLSGIIVVDLYILPIKSHFLLLK